MPPPITLTSPLPANDLMFESMNHSAGLSMLGETQLGLLSEKPDLNALDLLGPERHGQCQPARRRQAPLQRPRQPLWQRDAARPILRATR